MTTDLGYHIRDYQPGDEDGYTALFSEVFGQTPSRSQWAWKYAGTGAATVYAKLAVDPHQRIVGYAGAIPLKGVFQGKAIPFFQVCDVMVHPTARGHMGSRNLFTGLARALLDSIHGRFPEAFCYGFPGRRPFQLGARARVYAEIENAIETRRPGRLTRRWPLVQTRPLAWTDDRLDGLWARLSDPLALMLIRDGDYLRWRYAQHPCHRYDLLGLFFCGGLIGWAVSRRIDHRLAIVDLLLKRRWLRAALRALDAGVPPGEDMSIWLPSGWREKAGQRQPTPVITAHMIWKSSFTTPEARKRLYYTMGDLDIF